MTTPAADVWLLIDGEHPATTLATFLEANEGFDAATVAAVQALPVGGILHGGGGGAASRSVLRLACAGKVSCCPRTCPSRCDRCGGHCGGTCAPIGPCGDCGFTGYPDRSWDGNDRCGGCGSFLRVVVQVQHALDRRPVTPAEHAQPHGSGHERDLAPRDAAGRCDLRFDLRAFG